MMQAYIVHDGSARNLTVPVHRSQGVNDFYLARGPIVIVVHETAFTVCNSGSKYDSRYTFNYFNPQADGPLSVRQDSFELQDNSLVAECKFWYRSA